MTPTEKNLFEAYAILQAHANLLGNVIAQGNDAELLAAIERVNVAAKAYLGLPRPQQKAA